MPELYQSVLVVEDDSSVLKLVEKLMKRAGFSIVDTAVDGGVALAKMSVYCYQVVILDLMMPRVSGFELLEKISPADHRRIVVTSAISNDELSRLDRYDVFAVLQKPFEISELIATVRECAEARNVVLDAGAGKRLAC